MKRPESHQIEPAELKQRRVDTAPLSREQTLPPPLLSPKLEETSQRVMLPSASSIIKEVESKGSQAQMIHNQLYPPAPPLTSAQPTSAEEQEKASKQQHAIDFLYKVRDQYASNPKVYNDFLEIMKGFKSGSFETQEVIEKVKNLFQGNDALIEGFNLFLPPGYKIEPTVPNRTEPSLPTAPIPQNGNNQENLEHARNYVRKIKNRFALQPMIYKSFLEILHGYYQGQHAINEVLDEVSELFRNHPDLLAEFKHFLPKTVNGGQQSALQQSLGSPSVHGTQKKVKDKKKPKGERGEKTKLEKQKSEKQKQDKPEKSKKEERIELRSQDKRPKKEDRKKIRDLEVEKKAVVEQGLYKEYNFFYEARNRLKSKVLYHELLSCIHLFSQDAITKLELMFLVRDILTPHKDLYEAFKQFIGFDDFESAKHKYIPATKNHIKTKEDLLELETVIEMDASTIRALEELLQANTSDSFSLNSLNVSTIENIELLYGNRGPEIVDALFQKPAVAVPVILKRLRMKQLEWKKLKEAVELELERKQSPIAFSQAVDGQLPPSSLVSDSQPPSSMAQQDVHQDPELDQTSKTSSPSGTEELPDLREGSA